VSAVVEPRYVCVSNIQRNSSIACRQLHLGNSPYLKTFPVSTIVSVDPIKLLGWKSMKVSRLFHHTPALLPFCFKIQFNKQMDSVLDSPLTPVATKFFVVGVEKRTPSRTT
jgi:hypothetical protein